MSNKPEVINGVDNKNTTFENSSLTSDILPTDAATIAPESQDLRESKRAEDIEQIYQDMVQDLKERQQQNPSENNLDEKAERQEEIENNNLFGDPRLKGFTVITIITAAENLSERERIFLANYAEELSLNARKNSDKEKKKEMGRLEIMQIAISKLLSSKQVDSVAKNLNKGVQLRESITQIEAEIVNVIKETQGLGYANLKQDLTNTEVVQEQQENNELTVEKIEELKQKIDSLANMILKMEEASQALTDKDISIKERQTKMQQFLNSLRSIDEQNFYINHENETRKEQDLLLMREMSSTAFEERFVTIEELKNLSPELYSILDDDIKLHHEEKVNILELCYERVCHYAYAKEKVNRIFNEQLEKSKNISIKNQLENWLFCLSTLSELELKQLSSEQKKEINTVCAEAKKEKVEFDSSLVQILLIGDREVFEQEVFNKVFEKQYSIAESQKYKLLLLAIHNGEWYDFFISKSQNEQSLIKEKIENIDPDFYDYGIIAHVDRNLISDTARLYQRKQSKIIEVYEQLKLDPDNIDAKQKFFIHAKSILSGKYGDPSIICNMKISENSNLTYTDIFSKYLGGHEAQFFTLSLEQNQALRVRNIEEVSKLGVKLHALDVVMACEGKGDRKILFDTIDVLLLEKAEEKNEGDVSLGKGIYEFARVKNLNELLQKAEDNNVINAQEKEEVLAIYNQDFATLTAINIKRILEDDIIDQTQLLHVISEYTSTSPDKISLNKTHQILKEKLGCDDLALYFYKEAENGRISLQIAKKCCNDLSIESNIDFSEKNASSFIRSARKNRILDFDECLVLLEKRGLSYDKLYAKLVTPTSDPKLGEEQFKLYQELVTNEREVLKKIKLLLDTGQAKECIRLLKKENDKIATMQQKIVALQGEAVIKIGETGINATPELQRLYAQILEHQKLADLSNKKLNDRFVFPIISENKEEKSEVQIPILRFEEIVDIGETEINATPELQRLYAQILEHQKLADLSNKKLNDRFVFPIISENKEEKSEVQIPILRFEEIVDIEKPQQNNIIDEKDLYRHATILLKEGKTKEAQELLMGIFKNHTSNKKESRYILQEGALSIQDPITILRGFDTDTRDLLGFDSYKKNFTELENFQLENVDIFTKLLDSIPKYKEIEIEKTADKITAFIATMEIEERESFIKELELSTEYLDESIIFEVKKYSHEQLDLLAVEGSYKRNASNPINVNIQNFASLVQRLTPKQRQFISVDDVIKTNEQYYLNTRAGQQKLELMKRVLNGETLSDGEIFHYIATEASEIAKQIAKKRAEVFTCNPDIDVPYLNVKEEKITAIEVLEKRLRELKNNYSEVLIKQAVKTENSPLMPLVEILDNTLAETIITVEKEEVLKQASKVYMARSLEHHILLDEVILHGPNAGKNLKEVIGDNDHTYQRVRDFHRLLNKHYADNPEFLLEVNAIINSNSSQWIKDGNNRLTKAKSACDKISANHLHIIYDDHNDIYKIFSQESDVIQRQLINQVFAGKYGYGIVDLYTGDKRKANFALANENLQSMHAERLRTCIRGEDINSSAANLKYIVTCQQDRILTSDINEIMAIRRFYENLPGETPYQYRERINSVLNIYEGLEQDIAKLLTEEDKRIIEARTQGDKISERAHLLHQSILSSTKDKTIHAELANEILEQFLTSPKIWNEYKKIYGMDPVDKMLEVNAEYLIKLGHNHDPLWAQTLRTIHLVEDGVVDYSGLQRQALNYCFPELSHDYLAAITRYEKFGFPTLISTVFKEPYVGANEVYAALKNKGYDDKRIQETLLKYINNETNEIKACKLLSILSECSETNFNKKSKEYQDFLLELNTRDFSNDSIRSFFAEKDPAQNGDDKISLESITALFIEKKDERIFEKYPNLKPNLVVLTTLVNSEKPTYAQQLFLASQKKNKEELYLLINHLPFDDTKDKILSEYVSLTGRSIEDEIIAPNTRLGDVADSIGLKGIKEWWYQPDMQGQTALQNLSATSAFEKACQKYHAIKAMSSDGLLGAWGVDMGTGLSASMEQYSKESEILLKNIDKLYIRLNDTSLDALTKQKILNEIDIAEKEFIRKSDNFCEAAQLRFEMHERVVGYAKNGVVTGTVIVVSISTGTAPLYIQMIAIGSVAGGSSALTRIGLLGTSNYKQEHFVEDVVTVFADGIVFPGTLNRVHALRAAFSRNTASNVAKRGITSNLTRGITYLPRKAGGMAAESFAYGSVPAYFSGATHGTLIAMYHGEDHPFFKGHQIGLSSAAVAFGAYQPLKFGVHRIEKYIPKFKFGSQQEILVETQDNAEGTRIIAKENPIEYAERMFNEAGNRERNKLIDEEVARLLAKRPDNVPLEQYLKSEGRLINEAVEGIQNREIQTEFRFKDSPEMLELLEVQQNTKVIIDPEIKARVSEKLIKKIVEKGRREDGILDPVLVRPSDVPIREEILSRFLSRVSMEGRTPVNVETTTKLAKDIKDIGFSKQKVKSELVQETTKAEVTQQGEVAVNVAKQETPIPETARTVEKVDYVKSFKKSFLQALTKNKYVQTGVILLGAMRAAPSLRAEIPVYHSPPAKVAHTGDISAPHGAKVETKAEVGKIEAKRATAETKLETSKPAAIEEKIEVTKITERTTAKDQILSQKVVESDTQLRDTVIANKLTTNTTENIGVTDVITKDNIRVITVNKVDSNDIEGLKKFYQNNINSIIDFRFQFLSDVCSQTMDSIDNILDSIKDNNYTANVVIVAQANSPIMTVASEETKIESNSPSQETQTIKDSINKESEAKEQESTEQKQSEQETQKEQAKQDNENQDSMQDAINNRNVENSQQETQTIKDSINKESEAKEQESTEQKQSEQETQKEQAKQDNENQDSMQDAINNRNVENSQQETQTIKDSINKESEAKEQESTEQKQSEQETQKEQAKQDNENQDSMQDAINNRNVENSQQETQTIKDSINKESEAKEQESTEQKQSEQETQKEQAKQDNENQDSMQDAINNRNVENSQQETQTIKDSINKESEAKEQESTEQKQSEQETQKEQAKQDNENQDSMQDAINNRNVENSQQETQTEQQKEGKKEKIKEKEKVKEPDKKNKEVIKLYANNGSNYFSDQITIKIENKTNQPPVKYLKIKKVKDEKNEPLAVKREYVDIKVGRLRRNPETGDLEYIEEVIQRITIIKGDGG